MITSVVMISDEDRGAKFVLLLSLLDNRGYGGYGQRGAGLLTDYSSISLSSNTLPAPASTTPASTVFVLLLC